MHTLYPCPTGCDVAAYCYENNVFNLQFQTFPQCLYIAATVSQPSNVRNMAFTLQSNPTGMLACVYPTGWKMSRWVGALCVGTLAVPTDWLHSNQCEACVVSHRAAVDLNTAWGDKKMWFWFRLGDWNSWLWLVYDNAVNFRHLYESLMCYTHHPWPLHPYFPLCYRKNALFVPLAQNVGSGYEMWKCEMRKCAIWT